MEIGQLTKTKTQKLICLLNYKCGPYNYTKTTLVLGIKNTNIGYNHV